MLTVYAYENCSTCRRALSWLTLKRIPFVVKPIRTEPPTRAELARMLKSQNGQLRKLFNTSGTDYRALKLGARMDEMGVDEAFALLSSNGNLVKRPFVLSGTTGLVGFDPESWSRALR